MVPQMIPMVETPNVSLILESSRKDIQIGTWRKGAKVCRTRRLLKIGKGEGEDDPDKLGFSEIYFQWLIQIDNYNFLAFPIENEALLKQGYRLQFGNDYKLKSSTKIEPMAENAMRPTAILWRHPEANKGVQLLMIGGRADRNSQIYDVQTNTWQMAPRLPLSHNITTNVCVNYKEEAIFTFIVDAKLTVKSAVMDLRQATFTDPTTENTQEMDWAFENTLEQHGIDRLHLKCAVTQPDGKIAVIGRGRKKAMTEQIAGLVLIFEVSKDESGKYKLELKEQERIFPTIFSRQLDHLHACGTNLITVQDTPDEEKFEAYSIDMKEMRKDGKNKRHQKHYFEKPMEHSK